MGSCCTSRAVSTRGVAQSVGVGNANTNDQASKDYYDNNNNKSNNNMKGSDKASSKNQSGRDSEKTTAHDVNGSTSRRSACTLSNTSLTDAHKSINTSNDNNHHHIIITDTECTRLDETNSENQLCSKTDIKHNTFQGETYNEDTLSPMIVESQVTVPATHCESPATETTHYTTTNNTYDDDNNNDNIDKRRRKEKSWTKVENTEIPLLVRSHDNNNNFNTVTHPRGLSTSTSCLERSIMVMEDLITDTMQVSATSTTENPHSITNSYKYMNNDDLLTISSLVDVSQPTYTYNSWNGVNNNNNNMDNNNKNRGSINISERLHKRTLSDIDPTSDFDFTLAEQTDTPRLTYAQRERERHLLSSEVDGRARVIHLYLLTSRVLVINLCKEQFTVERLQMLQRFFLERSDLLLRIHVIDEAVQRKWIEVEWKRSEKLAIGEFIAECYAESKTYSNNNNNNKQIERKYEDNACNAAQQGQSNTTHKHYKRNTSEPVDTLSQSSSEHSSTRLVELNVRRGDSTKLSRRILEHEELEKHKSKLHSFPTLPLNSFGSTIPRIKRHVTRSLSSNSSLCSSSLESELELHPHSSSSSSFASSSSSSSSSSMWSEADGQEEKRKTKKKTKKDKECKYEANDDDDDENHDKAEELYSPPVATIISLQKFNVQKGSSSREKSSNAEKNKSKNYNYEIVEENEKINKEDEPQLLLMIESSTERPSSAPVRSSSSVTNVHERSTARDAHVRHTTTNNNNNNNNNNNSSDNINNNINCSNSMSSTNNFVNINSNQKSSSNIINNKNNNNNSNVLLTSDRESRKVENVTNDNHSSFVLPEDHADFTSKKSSMRVHSASRKGNKSRSSSNTRKQEKYNEHYEEEEEKNKNKNIDSNVEINALNLYAPLHAEEDESNYHYKDHHHNEYEETNKHREKKSKHKQKKYKGVESDGVDEHHDHKAKEINRHIGNFINDVNNEDDSGKEKNVNNLNDSVSLNVTDTHKEKNIESDMLHSLTSHSSQSNQYSTIESNIHHHHHKHNHHHNHHSSYRYSESKSNNKDDEDVLYSNGKTYSVLSKKKLQSKFVLSQRHSLRQEERELEEEEQEFAHLKTQSYGVMLSEWVEHEGNSVKSFSFPIKTR